jgi:hypothetical protein
MIAIIRYIAFLMIYLPLLFFNGEFPDKLQREKMPIIVAIIICLLYTAIIVGTVYLLFQIF